MAIPPPPPGFTLDTPGAAPPQGIGRPVIRKGETPPSPDLPQGWKLNSQTGQAERIGGLPSGFTEPKPDKPAAGDLPKGWHLNASGQAEPIPGLPAGLVEQPPSGTPGGDTSQDDVLLKQIAHIRELAKKPFSLGAGTGYLAHVPILGQNAADIRAKLQQVQGDLIQKGIARLRELNGGKGAATMANTEKEGQRIAASFAAVDPDQSPEEFVKGLDDAEAFYKRTLAKAQGGAPASAPTIDSSDVDRTAPPPVVPTDMSVGVSTTDKAVIDPRLAKIKPQLEQYLAADPSKVSNAMILGFIKKNGLDPSTLAGLKDNLNFRMSKQRKGVHWFPNVDPNVSKPLSAQGVGDTPFLSEQDRAQAAASPIGAGFAASADTATFGAMPDLVAAGTAATGGNYGDARREFKDKQNLVAYNQPGATAVGNLVGSATTGLAAAPESFGGLLASAGKQGGAYGFMSSDDPSFLGRLESGVRSGAVNAVAAGVGDPALRGVAKVAGKGSNAVSRALGTSSDEVANAEALKSFAAHAPNQDVPAMRARQTEQAGLSAEPTGLTSLDRSGQDYLGRQVAKSPGARQAADEAVATAQDRLPGQLEADFGQAIDDAAGDDKNVAAFLKRPARDIASDIQGMAGREYEAGIEPIKNEKLTIDADLAEALTHERIKGAVADALSSHNLSDETRQVLRQLPRSLQSASDAIKPPSAQLGGAAAEQVAALQAQVREQTLQNIPLTVDAARNLATALDRTAARLSEGSEGIVELRRLSSGIRQKIGEQYPEFAPVNARYAARQRAIGALDDARRTFLGDSTGEKTDTLAKAAAKMSDQPGEPEFKGPPTEKNGFAVTKPPQAMPSEKQMAIAGAREATVAKAANSEGAGAAERLSNVGQKERNRMILADRAGKLEARSKAQAKNVRTIERLSSGGTGDDTGGKVQAGVKAIANAGFHRGGAMVASMLSGIRGLSPEDAARVVKLYTDPGKVETVIASLEKAYGRRKARFIIDRIASMALTANKSRTLPDEAVQSGNDQ